MAKWMCVRINGFYPVSCRKEVGFSLDIRDAGNMQQHRLINGPNLSQKSKKIGGIKVDFKTIWLCHMEVWKGHK